MRDAKSTRLQKCLQFGRWLCAAGLLASSALATDFPVTTTNDSGAGSERQGIASATNGDRLVFDSALNGLTLANSGSLTINNSITLLDSNGITLTDSHAYTLAKPLTIDWAGTLNMSGILSDGATAGSLIKTGTGTLVLSGSNSYTGGTTLNGGTLSVLNSNALGTGGLTVHGLLGSTTLNMGDGVRLNNNVLLQGDLIVNSAAATTGRIGGNITESGGPFGLNFTGDGTLVLSGTNTFSGGIYVSNGGTLRAESNPAFGTGTINVNGSLTLDLANGINVGNHIHLNNNFTTNVDSGTATLSGIIDDLGGSQMSKTGSGTLILGGNNTYSGLTTINAGELRVQNSNVSDILIANSTAMLSGSGSVGNVTNNGVIQPGNAGIGNLTVNGNFTQNASGTTQIRVNSGGTTPGVNNDHLTVNGTANLDGALKIVGIGGGTINSGSTYTILNATTNVSGQYSSVSTNLSLFTLNVTYDPNDVTVQLQRSSYIQAAGTTTNQIAVGSAMDNIALTSSGGLFSMINTLGAESTPAQQQALNQLSGEIYGNTQTIAIQAGDLFQQRIETRLVSNGQFLAGQPQSGSDVRGQSPVNSNGGWIQGFGVGGGLHSDGNGAGVRYSQGGAIYGMDLGADESGVIGIAGGNSYVGFHDAFAAGGQMTSYQAGLYALKHNDTAYALGSLTYGFDDFGSNRNVLVGGSNQTLRGNFVGHQLGAYAETGLKYHMGWVHVQPLVGLQYLYLAQQGFSESGGPAALNVSATQADSLRSSVGGRLVVDQLTGPYGAVWTPYWHARWVSELLDNDRIVNASFGGGPIGGAFTTHGTRLGQNYGVYGKGTQVQLNEQWSLFANVDLMFGGRIQQETGSFGALYIW